MEVGQTSYIHPVKIEPPSTPSTGQASNGSSLGGGYPSGYGSGSTGSGVTTQPPISRPGFNPSSAEFDLIKENLEKTLSDKSKDRIQRIVDQVESFSDVDRLLLCLRLPIQPRPTPTVTSTGANDVLSLSNNTTEGDGGISSLNLSNQVEQSQAFTWIVSHLEEDPNTCLRKDEVYEDYRTYCDNHKMKPLNTADFGKVMKRAFPNVKPRRLGQRGQSRYCYGGMRKRMEVQPPSLPDIKMELLYGPNSASSGYQGAQNAGNGVGWGSNGCVMTTISEEGGMEMDPCVGVSGSLLAHCSQLVVEYTEKLLGHHFVSLFQLAEHLVSNMYVNTRSRAAFALVAEMQQRSKHEGRALGPLPNKKALSSQLFSPNVKPPNNAVDKELLRKLFEDTITKRPETNRRNSGSTICSEGPPSHNPGTPSTPGSTLSGCPGTPASSTGGYSFSGQAGTPGTPTTPTNNSLTTCSLGGQGQNPIEVGTPQNRQQFNYPTASTGVYGNQNGGIHMPQTPSYPSLQQSSSYATPSQATPTSCGVYPVMSQSGQIPTAKPQLLTLPQNITRDNFSGRRQPGASGPPSVGYQPSPTPPGVASGQYQPHTLQLASSSQYPGQPHLDSGNAPALHHFSPHHTYSTPPSMAPYSHSHPAYMGPPNAHMSHGPSTPSQLPPAPPPIVLGSKSPYAPVGMPSKRNVEDVSSAPGSFDPLQKFPRMDSSPSKRVRYHNYPSGGVTSDLNLSSMERDALMDFYHLPQDQQQLSAGVDYPGRYDGLGMLSPLPASGSAEDMQPGKYGHRTYPSYGGPLKSSCHVSEYDDPLPRLGASPAPPPHMHLNHQDTSSTFYGSGGREPVATLSCQGDPHDDLHTPTLGEDEDVDNSNLSSSRQLPRIGSSPRPQRDDYQLVPSPPNKLTSSAYSSRGTVAPLNPLLSGSTRGQRPPSVSQVGTMATSSSSCTLTNKENRLPDLTYLESRCAGGGRMLSGSTPSSTTKPATPDDKRVTSTTILSPASSEFSTGAVSSYSSDKH